MAWAVVLFCFSGFPRALALKWQTAPRFFIFQYKPPNGELSWQKDTLYSMKKSFLSLMLTLCLFAGSAIAQSSMLATLSHEGEISVFYGADALKEAHTAAAHGDVITLSSGSFNATNITKAITLRGAGLEIDSVKNIHPTVILGSFSISIGDSISEQLTIEGIYNDYVITVTAGLNNATFIKNKFCFFEFDTKSGNTAQYLNNRFIHCKIEYRFFAANYASKKSLSFMNCYIKSIFNNDNSSIFTNCIIHNVYDIYTRNNIRYFTGLHNLSYCTLYNCILVGDSNNSNYEYNVLPSTATAYNCIATNVYSNYNVAGKIYYVFKGIPNSTNRVIPSIGGVFKSYTSYNDFETFEILDALKTGFLGTDGTQVGIHGGSLPYSPATTNPQITKCNVAPRSTADGKLSIDIEVKTGE